MNVSTVLSAVRQSLIGAESQVSISEFYLTGDDTRLEFSMTPEDVRIKTGASFRSYNVIESGEIKIPKGETLSAVSWKGTLPGAAMLNYQFVKADAWQNPDDIIKTIDKWRTNGSKLKLLITQTPVNLDVYIKSFSTTHKGGLGNVDYTIDLIAAKALTVRTVGEVDSSNGSMLNSAFGLLNRQSKSKSSVRLTQVDSIFEAAQFLTGNGGDWATLLRRNGLGLDIDAIDPLTVLH